MSRMPQTISEDADRISKRPPRFASMLGGIAPPTESADTIEAPETVLIKADGLSFYYGKHQALHDVSLNISSRRITAFIGPSGCGKSTFLRTFNRMYESVGGTRVEGRVLLDGRDVRSMDLVDLRRRVGMVFQRPNPFAKSIFDNVAFGLRVNGLAKGRELANRVEKNLRKAALWDEVKDKLNESAYSLSGGQQQRLCIARALAAEPDVLLMDEPCSALDPVATTKVEDLLHTLKLECTLVMVTHNMQQAARVADYTGFFLMGKLVEFDTTKKMFHKPAKTETEDYITGRFG